MSLWPTPADEEAARDCVERLGREVLADSVLYHAFLAGKLHERERAAQVAESVKDAECHDSANAACNIIAREIRKGPQP